MTIPRVLLFAALLVLGFMIWGIHQDVFTLTQEARGLKDVIIRQPTPPVSGETSRPMKAVPLPRPRPKHRPTLRSGPASRIHRPMHHHGLLNRPLGLIAPVQGDTPDDTVVFRLP